ncbi:MAG: tetrahydrofolate dehydrogenase/cyclohydrolase catalytic domain-containing protein, partial [Smithella sp.]
MFSIIDGNKIAQDIRNEVRISTLELKQKGIVPGLAVILVGDDPASKIYVGKKSQDCAEVGFLSREYKLPEATSEEKLLSLIDDLNKDKLIHGILV